jgi:hypothetical protein
MRGDSYYSLSYPSFVQLHQCPFCAGIPPQASNAVNSVQQGELSNAFFLPRAMKNMKLL